jgi:hypothetical protein
VPIASVRAADSYVPLGPSAETVLVTEPQIEAAARSLCGDPGGAGATGVLRPRPPEPPRR